MSLIYKYYLQRRLTQRASGPRVHTNRQGICFPHTHTHAPNFTLAQGELVHLVKGKARWYRWDWSQTCLLLTGRIELLISQQIVLWGIHVSAADLPDSTKPVAVWNSVGEGLKELCTLNQDYFQRARLHLDKSGQRESISLLVDEYKQLPISGCPNALSFTL